MAQNKEKEETELKVPGNLPLCSQQSKIRSPSPPMPAAARSSAEIVDPRLPAIVDDSTSSPTPKENRGVLKRPREVARCSGTGCKKKIGLIGFRCRCGEVFCSEHRYSDRHDCSYDYKAAGRDAIARENPVVRAAKLLKV